MGAHEVCRVPPMSRNEAECFHPPPGMVNGHFPVAAAARSGLLRALQPPRLLMLNFFRRHRGAFLITLTVIIIVSFSFWGGWRKSRGEYESKAKATDHALTVFGKDYTIGDVERVQRSLQFAQYYMQAYELPGMLMQLSGGGGANTLVNLFVARHDAHGRGSRRALRRIEGRRCVRHSIAEGGRLDQPLAGAADQGG